MEKLMDSIKKRQKPSLPAAKRQVVSLAPEASIKIGHVLDGAHLPVEIQPTVDGFDLIAWCQQNKQLLENMLLEHNAILFRRCGIDAMYLFNRFVTTLYGESLMEYKDRSTPRQELAPNIYTSTIYPAERRIALHNEGTYWI